MPVTVVRCSHPGCQAEATYRVGSPLAKRPIRRVEESRLLLPGPHREGRGPHLGTPEDAAPFAGRGPHLQSCSCLRVRPPRDGESPRLGTLADPG